MISSSDVKKESDEIAKHVLKFVKVNEESKRQVLSKARENMVKSKNRMKTEYVRRHGGGTLFRVGDVVLRRNLRRDNRKGDWQQMPWVRGVPLTSLPPTSLEPGAFFPTYYQPRRLRTSDRRATTLAQCYLQFRFNCRLFRKKADRNPHLLYLRQPFRQVPPSRRQEFKLAAIFRLWPTRSVVHRVAFGFELTEQAMLGSFGSVLLQAEPSSKRKRVFGDWLGSVRSFEASTLQIPGVKIL